MMQAAINLQGEQVEFQERKEKHDLRKEILLPPGHSGAGK